MRVDITLHEVSDTYEETLLDGIEIPRLPRIGETVHLTLPEREVGGKVILVGHRFAVPGVPTLTGADAWFALKVGISTDNQGNATFRDEQEKIITINPRQKRGMKSGDES